MAGSRVECQSSPVQSLCSCYTVKQPFLMHRSLPELSLSYFSWSNYRTTFLEGFNFFFVHCYCPLGYALKTEYLFSQQYSGDLGNGLLLKFRICECPKSSDILKVGIIEDSDIISSSFCQCLRKAIVTVVSCHCHPYLTLSPNKKPARHQLWISRITYHHLTPCAGCEFINAQGDECLEFSD